MPNKMRKGAVDYVLFGDNGKPLAVVEAKRTSKDPNVGKQQAKLYADCLEMMCGQRPIIFYTNGFETYMWDDLEYPARRVSGFYNKEELSLLIDRRSMKVPLDPVYINDDITNRYYQKKRFYQCAKQFVKSNEKRYLLWQREVGRHVYQFPLLMF